MIVIFYSQESTDAVKDLVTAHQSACFYILADGLAYGLRVIDKIPEFNKV